MRKNIKIDVMMPVKIGFAVMLLMGLVTLAIILKETQFIFSLGSVLESAIVISAYDLSLMGAVTIIFISAISLWSLSSGKLLALRNKLAFVTLPNYGYAMVLFAIKMILVYSLYQALLLIAYSVSQVAELSSSFMPLPNYLHESSSLQYFKMLTFVVISLLILTKPKDKMNPGFLIGLAVVPMVISLCLPQIYNFMLSMIGSNMTELPNLSEYETLVFGTSSGFIGIFMTLALVYFLLLMPACYAYASVNKQNFSSFMKWIILGYASSILATAIAASYICNSDSASYIKNNHNIETVALNGKTYRYDLSLVKVPENDYETEFLIESYMGQSMHNSTEVFDYLTSDNYKGDKEKAIEFLSTLHLRNYRLFKKYKENFLKAAKQPMTTTDYMRGAIPLIIYENAPLEMLERTLVAANEKRYQDAIDYYIEDILNSNRDAVSSFNHEKIEGPTTGNPYIQAIVRGIISQKLATIDLSLVKSEKIRNYTIQSLNETESTTHFSDEQVENWYQMFMSH